VVDPSSRQFPFIPPPLPPPAPSPRSSHPRPVRANLQPPHPAFPVPPVQVGFDIMGSPVVEEKALKESPIVVLRGDTALHSGSEYKSGETLSVKLEGRAGMYCMEVRPALPT
jgi:hypothetical protein